MPMNPHEQNIAAYRDMLIANAVKARKIAADRADDYRRLYDASPKTIDRLLTAPVEQGGLMAGINVGGDPFPEQPTEYPREWLAASRPNGSVTFEDPGGSRPPTPAAPAALPAAPRSRITMEP